MLRPDSEDRSAQALVAEFVKEVLHLIAKLRVSLLGTRATGTARNPRNAARTNSGKALPNQARNYPLSLDEAHVFLFAT